MPRRDPRSEGSTNIVQLRSPANPVKPKEPIRSAFTYDRPLLPAFNLDTKLAMTPESSRGDIMLDHANHYLSGLQNVDRLNLVNPDCYSGRYLTKRFRGPQPPIREISLFKPYVYENSKSLEPMDHIRSGLFGLVSGIFGTARQILSKREEENSVDLRDRLLRLATQSISVIDHYASFYFDFTPTTIATSTSLDYRFFGHRAQKPERFSPEPGDMNKFTSVRVGDILDPGANNEYMDRFRTQANALMKSTDNRGPNCALLLCSSNIIKKLDNSRRLDIGDNVVLQPFVIDPKGQSKNVRNTLLPGDPAYITDKFSSGLFSGVVEV